MASSSAVSPPTSAPASTTAVPVASSVNDDLRRLNFALKIAHKLDEKNFHLWRQQVESYINARNLTEFIVCAQIPPQFLNDADCNSGTINPAYSVWLQKDQMLLSWLQSTLSSEIRISYGIAYSTISKNKLVLELVS